VKDRLRRPGPLAIACVVVPLVTVGLTLGSGADEAADQPLTEAESTALTRATVVCPTSGQDGAVMVASDAGADGELSVEAGNRDPRPLEVTSGRVSRVRGQGSQQAVSVTGTGALAPGLTATRTASPGLRAVECRPVTSDQWFAGVGAGAEHRSVLELHNPDSGPAAVQVALLGQSGPVQERGLRGLTVAGGDTVRLELAEQIPKREELAMRVTTTRGRVAVSVLDGFDPIGQDAETRDYLVGQADPSTDSHLLGLPTRPGNAALVVANPGEDAARVKVRLVTEQSVFAPARLEEVQVRAGSVVRLSISRLLASDVAEGVVGLRVESSEPVVSAFRGRRGGDLLTLSPGERVTGPTLLAVPAGGKRLVLGGATSLGTATVVSLDEKGRELAREAVEVQPDRAVVVPLPERSGTVRVEPDRTSLVGSVLLQGEAGAAVLGLRELVREGRVPAVLPGLP